MKYLLILAWTCSPISTFCYALILRYLVSKPLMCQTVMDVANYAFFGTLIVTNILITLIVTVTNFVNDSGEFTALILAWHYFFMIQCIVLEAMVILTLQMFLVQRPSLLESKVFELAVKGIALGAVPLLAASLCLAIGLNGSKPYEYSYLRGIEGELRDVGLETIGICVHSIFLILFVVSRIMIKRNGYDLNGKSNHIIQPKVIAGLVTVSLVGYVLVGANHSSKDYKFIVIILYSLFSILTLFAHISLHAFAMRRSPFRQLLALMEWVSTVTRSRRVGIVFNDDIKMIDH